MESTLIDKSQTIILCGPLLKYIGTDYTRKTWRGSCLLVSNTPQPPTLFLNTLPSVTLAETIDIYRNEYYFWRFEIKVPLLSQHQTISYRVSCIPDQGFEFHLPAIQDSMRFMFYSCNGFSNDVPQVVRDRFSEREAPLWQDVLDQHQIAPFHVMLGGGDQIYQDDLVSQDFMKPWMSEKNPKERLAMAMSQDMKDGFEHYYFWNYIRNFGSKHSPIQAKAYASIPSINMWDDHDIIDGYGSYPEEMQSADCFKVLFENASRFYYAFQHHTTLERAELDGMIRGGAKTCHHVLTTLGSDIGFLALDARGERTKHQVCSDASYDVLFTEMQRRMPPSVKHFIVLTGVPIIYPRLTLFEKALESLSDIDLATLVGKTGALGDLIAHQLNYWNGDPELLDDLNDHWNATSHQDERIGFIKRLQNFAKEKSIRVTFFGGDVHCCAVGKMFSKDKVDHEHEDPYLMFQIVSSAIVNVPPPRILLTILNQFSKTIDFDENIEEQMIDLFKLTPNGNCKKNQKLMGMRNYCIGEFSPSNASMCLSIRVEAVAGIKGTKEYLVEVPMLKHGKLGEILHGIDQIKNSMLESNRPAQQESLPEIKKRLKGSIQKIKNLKFWKKSCI